jgi:hypothetical protein
MAVGVRRNAALNCATGRCILSSYIYLENLGFKIKLVIY